MLLSTRVAAVPAQAEIDADLGEYGMLSNKSRAAFGQAAVEVGALDRDEPRADVIDALANIAHYCAQREIDFREAVKVALIHFGAEQALKSGSRVTELDESVIGKRIRVLHVEESPEADRIIAGTGNPTDPERLTGLTGIVRDLRVGTGWAQLDVYWDHSDGGTLHLCDVDRVEVIG